MMMKLQIAAGLVVATFVGLTTTSASAVIKPTNLTQAASLVQQAKCLGFRVNYSSFAKCMKANPGAHKHCNKICQY